MQKVTEADLKIELSEMRERFPALQDSDLFVAWFLKCFVTDKEEEAIAALVGGPRDKNLDAVFIDEPSKSVFLIQGKYRQRMNGALENRSEVTAFAQLAQTFSDQEEFKSYLKDLDVGVAAKAEKARNYIRTRGYRIQLYYVTTGRCSTTLADEAQRIIRNSEVKTSIEIVDGKRVLLLLSDYLNGVAPPVPLLELEIESGQGIKLDGVLQRFDGNTHIESFVFPVSVEHIAEMYEQSGVRLFARNVRGFLGQTAINRNMELTLDNEPEFFWYYNNGITIVCDSAEKTSRGGRNVIRVINPQVINGQQTTRTLHKKGVQKSKATVLVRVISVPRVDDMDSIRFENLVSKIVAATNWQNAIRASDLMANDRRQIELERNLRKLDYQYLRKRQSKGEAKRNAGVRHRFLVSKEELAQAVAACDLDPALVREGKERLFEERHYAHVFPNVNPNYYLPRYWLVKYVSKAAKGFPERAYAKWVVTNFVWNYLEKVLNSRTLKEVFVRENERAPYNAFDNVCHAAFRGALAFYRSRRGKGETGLDVSTFFQKKGLHHEFKKFWPKVPGTHKKQFQKSLKRFTAEFLQDANSE